MSVADHFRQGYRNAQLLAARAGQGTVEGRGLLKWTASVEPFDGELQERGPDAECAIGLMHSVTEIEAKRALLNYIGKSTKINQNLVGEVVIDSCRMFFAPAYVYDCTSDTEWSAAFGYDRSEYFTDHQRVYQNGQYVTKAVTRENIVTDWQPQSGYDSQQFVKTMYAGSDLPGAVVGWVESADFGNAASLTNSEREKLDTDECTHDAFGTFRRYVNDEGLREVAYGVHDCLQGDRVRDCQWSTHVDAQAILALVPVCQVSFTVRGERYSFYVHGRDAARCACDPLPTIPDQKKTGFRALPAVYAVIAGLVLVFGRGENRGPEGIIWLAMCIGLFIYGCVRQSNYDKRVAGRQNDVLQTRLRELESGNSQNEQGVADVYEEEASPLDRYDAKYIPVFLVVAMSFTLYRTHHVETAVESAAAPVVVRAALASAPAPAPAPAPVPAPNAVAAASPVPVQPLTAETARSIGPADIQGGRVTDAAGLLTADERAQLSARVRQLNEGGKLMVSVLIVQSTAPETIDAYAKRVANEARLGSPGKSNGILLVVAPGNTPDLKRLRIEVGRDLTAQLPDSAAAAVLKDAIIPNFQREQYFAGLDASLLALAERLPAEESLAEPRAGTRNAIQLPHDADATF